jgi:glutathione reductase (NADPH)
MGRVQRAGESMESCDVMVIGTGVSGQTAAWRLARAGLSVATVDRRSYGGTCPQRGCEPKKVLLGPVDAVERTRALSGRGTSGDASVSWRSDIAFARGFTSAVPARIEGWLQEAGVRTLHGNASFASGGAMTVDGVQWSVRDVVIASGARPLTLGIPGEELITTSETFMTTDTVPERVVFIGGGYISMEFAHMSAAAGSHVTVLHRGPRLLRGFDTDLVMLLTEAYAEHGVTIRTDTPVAAVRSAVRSLIVETAAGGAIECEMVVHGAGRVPDIEGLDLDAAGVRWGRHGVEVDEHMRSVSAPRVHAIGDAAALGSPLTPVGIMQGEVAAADIIEPGSACFRPPVTPSVVFSSPPLASVGLSAEQAEGREDVAVSFSDTSEWFTSRRLGLSRSGAKLLAQRGTGRLLGAHLLGDHADEVINVLALAIAQGLTAEDLARIPWTYPTSSSDIRYLLQSLGT